MYYINSPMYNIVVNDEGIIFKYSDGSQLKYTESYIEFTNKYGDVTKVDSQLYQHSQAKRPTYDELYEHWLKTK